MAAKFFAYFIVFVALFSVAKSDPDLLQDICVAEATAGVKVNGFACKNDAVVTEADFFFSGLAKPAVINNTVGSVVTAANVVQIPGLNTLGVSLSRIDYLPGGLNPPHTHPRATEIIFVLEGELDGLVHFQKNNGHEPASVIAGFNSQFPGTQSIAATLFASTPAVPDNVLTKAFQVGTKEVIKIKSRLAPKKS
ncbi:Germin-like protein subfamily 2 member 4 [Hibiscus syriacus]|uniref:Germin-like protein subfamily 2 member 4 n=1 Tax=Hibiscus syriacus TaxID=106335 RepID=A0A6A3AK26_HIBSY|nr:Germin-like protein subfamily 2 member 4 [Hibiscus syriacus]